MRQVPSEWHNGSTAECPTCHKTNVVLVAYDSNGETVYRTPPDIELQCKWTYEDDRPESCEDQPCPECDGIVYLPINYSNAFTALLCTLCDTKVMI